MQLINHSSSYPPPALVITGKTARPPTVATVPMLISSLSHAYAESEWALKKCKIYISYID